MMYVRPEDLKPGMLLAEDLLGTRDEILLRRGQMLTSTLVAKLQRIDHQTACIIDGMDDASPEDFGLISERLKRNAVSAVRSLFNSIEGGNREAQQNSLNRARVFLDEIIDEISADRSMLMCLTDLKTYDEYTYHHSVSVAASSILLGVALGLKRAALYKLGMGALLHDVGKVFIQKQILHKPTALNDDEYEEMKKHSLLGYDYLREYWSGPTESIVAVLSHHEHYNGSGYPFGLAGDKQPFEARIIALSDVYDAITSERPYRTAVSPSEAVEHIMGNSGTLFDPQLVSIFAKKIVPYPVGSKVLLSNGQRGVVISNQSENLMRPKVRLLKIDIRNARVDDKAVDLLNDPAYWNVTILGLDK
jgi:HD-GYP domain-containing protein (c-di-GMP phosphodiesterase class II)